MCANIKTLATLKALLSQSRIAFVSVTSKDLTVFAPAATLAKIAQMCNTELTVSLSGASLQITSK